mmetsp:Transcript_86222/g.157248  ORF Transcript_86222/g.157248 Transcript_86222/m.157248 type:complete len:673 (-) Transcript_86222:3-2021(-)
MRTTPAGAAQPAVVPPWRNERGSSQAASGSKAVRHREVVSSRATRHSETKPTTKSEDAAATQSASDGTTTKSEDAAATQNASDGKRPVTFRLRPVAKRGALKRERAATEPEPGQSSDAALESEAKQRKTEEHWVPPDGTAQPEQSEVADQRRVHDELQEQRLAAFRVRKVINEIYLECDKPSIIEEDHLGALNSQLDAVYAENASFLGQNADRVSQEVSRAHALLEKKALADSDQQQNCTASGKQVEPRVIPPRVAQPKKVEPKPPSKPPPADVLRLAAQEVGTGDRGQLPSVKASASSSAGAAKEQASFHVADLVEMKVSNNAAWAPAFIVDILPDGRFRLLVHRPDKGEYQPTLTIAGPDFVRRRHVTDGLLERRFKALGLELSLVNYAAQQILEIDTLHEKLARSRDEWIELTTRISDHEAVLTADDEKTDNDGNLVEEQEANGSRDEELLEVEEVVHHGWGEPGVAEPEEAAEEGFHGHIGEEEDKVADALPETKKGGADQGAGRRFEGVILQKRRKEQLFGFIECSELKGDFTKDVFVHGTMMGSFSPGDNVSFELVVKSGQPQAVNLSLARNVSRESVQSGDEAAEESDKGGLGDVSFIRTPLPLPKARPTGPSPPASAPPGHAKLGNASSASDGAAMPSQRNARLVRLPPKTRPPMFASTKSAAS